MARKTRRRPQKPKPFMRVPNPLEIEVLYKSGAGRHNDKRARRSSTKNLHRDFITELHEFYEEILEDSSTGVEI